MCNELYIYYIRCNYKQETKIVNNEFKQNT